MPTSKTNIAAPLTKGGTIDHRYNIPQQVKKDGSRDMRTNIRKTPSKR